MAIRRIVTAPADCLVRPSRPVEAADRATVEALAVDLLDTVRDAGGLGLAAPQLGVNLRVIVLGELLPGDHPRVLLNPEILRRKGGDERTAEGCLSLPGVQRRVVRPRRVVYGYLDIVGVWRVASASGLLARCLQHEVDHLDGILITDPRRGGA